METKGYTDACTVTVGLRLDPPIATGPTGPPSSCLWKGLASGSTAAPSNDGPARSFEPGAYELDLGWHVEDILILFFS